MKGSIERIEGGTVTSPKGFSAGGVYCGVKPYGTDKLDLGLIYSEARAVAAAVFTKNRVTAPAILVDRDYLKDPYAQAVVVNSGIANVSVGEQGADRCGRDVSVGREKARGYGGGRAGRQYRRYWG